MAKCTTKDTGFATINAKGSVARKANVIAANEGKFVYEIIEDALKCKYPKYF